MSRAKPKRSKAFKPHAPCYPPAILFHLPINKAQHDRLAVQMHTQVEVFIARPTGETGMALARTMTIISRALSMQRIEALDKRTDAPALAIVEVGKALEAVMGRRDRVGKYGVSDAEAEAIRKGAGTLDAAIGRMPELLIMEASNIADMEERQTWAAIREEKEGIAA